MNLVQDSVRNDSDSAMPFLFRDSPLPMWIYDLESLAFLDVNETAIALYEHTREEFLNMTIKDIRPADELPRLLQNIAQTTQGIARSGPWKHRTKSGREMDVEIVSNEVMFNDRRARLVVVHDVTARKQSENSLEEGLKLQNLLMRMATSFVNVPNDKIDDSINEALATIGMFVHADRAYLFKYDFERQMTSNTHEWCAEGISREIDNSQNIAIDLLAPAVSAHKRGEVYILPRVSDLPRDDAFRMILEPQKIQSLILFPMIAGGELIGFVGFDAVRTERRFASNEMALLKVLAEILANAEVRRRNEESLRESEEKFRALVENSTDLIWEIDAKGVYTYVSPQIQRILGYAPDEIIGKTPFDLMPADEASRVQELFSALLLERKSINALENVNRHKDGHLVVMETSGVPIVDRAGNFRGYRGIDRDITERNRVRDSLQQSEIKFRTVVENAQAVVFILDRDGVFLLSEGLGLATLGLKPGEVVGLSALELYKDHPTIVDGIKQALQGRPAQVITELHDLIFDTVYSPVLNNTGEVTSVVGIATDITERRRATEELRSKEERYRTLFSVSPVGIMLMEADGTILDINDAYTRSHQYTREELIGKDVRMLAPREEWRRVDRHLSRILAGEILEHEVVNTRKDGSFCVIELRETAIPLPNGGRGVLSIANDVSIRKNIEEALRSSEERYRRFFEENLTAVVISKPNGTVIDCNPSFVRMCGFSSYEEALTTNATLMYADPNQRTEILRLLKDRGKLTDYDVTLRQRNGSKLHAKVTLIGTFDQHGALTQIFGYWDDKTVQKQLEEQLLQAQKMESLGTLASGIAHDFNNILGIVLGHASLVTSAGMTREKMAHHAASILKATERGIGVVKQLLTFARKTEVHLEPVHINEIVTELAKLVRETFPKNVLFDMKLAEQIPTVIADVNQMHQVALNLCVNARDAMHNGGTLTISTAAVSREVLQQRWPEATAEAYALLAVADTGTGMDEATRSRIFDPFFTTKEHGKGTGLGLATVYGIVQTHKGWVDVQSELGRGTVFSIYLPIRTRPSAIVTAPEVQSDELPGGNEIILLVEDEPMLQEMVKELLTSRGYSVLTASNGEQGLDLYRRSSSAIALVVSDLGLPLIEGDELFLALKSLNPSVKFILASGFVDPQVRARLKAAGLHHIISKPYYPAHMLRTIRELLDS